MKISKETYNILSLASLGVFIYAIGKLLFNGKTSPEQKSNFNGADTQKIVFTLTNNTSEKQTQYLFDSLSGQTNNAVGVTSNLSFFNRELSNKPKVVSKIEFINIGSSSFNGYSNIDESTALSPTPIPVTPIKESSETITPITPIVSNGYNQAEAPFKMVCKDASGDASEKQYIPMVSSAQFQVGITSVDFDKMILDGTCYMAYTMYPNSKVAIIVYYENKPLSKLLKK